MLEHIPHHEFAFGELDLGDDVEMKMIMERPIQKDSATLVVRALPGTIWYPTPYINRLLLDEELLTEQLAQTTSTKMDPSQQRQMWIVFLLTVILMQTLLCSAHVGAWQKGMYCMKGNDGTDNPNSNDAFQPLYMLPKSEWWFHRVNNCDQFPPDEGDFLELPANGNFTVEHAVNRAFTTTTWQPPMLGVFGDGKDHPDLGISDDGKDGECIVEPNMHTQNETMAAGTAFAISYVSEIEEVTPENLVVFSVLYNTPWKRIATYQVPNLPPCPPNGCICAYGWVPNGCGEPNMYMQGFRCIVTYPSPDLNLTLPSPLSISLPRPLMTPAQPPVWCEDNLSKCVSGAKQMIFWHQLDGNNVFVSGVDMYGRPKSPGYNAGMGFGGGAQTDIFMPVN